MKKARPLLPSFSYPLVAFATRKEKKQAGVDERDRGENSGPASQQMKCTGLGFKPNRKKTGAPIRDPGP
jgi:hypothetical protein